MSGHHWADDPQLNARDSARRTNLAAAKNLGLDVRYIHTRAADGIAVCQDCRAMVWLGDMGFSDPTSDLSLHRERHLRRPSRNACAADRGVKHAAGQVKEDRDGRLQKCGA